MPRIAVTGASGFIGAVVTRQMLAMGWSVVALTRSSDARERLESAGVSVVPGSLDDVDALQTLVYGADVVVHCAGAVRGRDYADFAAVNVRGTQNLLAALHASDRGHEVAVVALSSLAARESSLSDYARSKHAMEGELAVHAESAPCLVLRPPAVYGPDDREMRPLFQAFARGVAPLPAPVGARVSLIFVEDLAAAVVAWLEQNRLQGGVFEIHDGRPGGYSWDEVIGTAETLLGRRIRKIRIPGRALGGFARGNARLSRLLGYAPMLTPGKLRELRHPDWVCDNAPLEAIVDWQPQVSLAQGLELTCGWRGAA